MRQELDDFAGEIALTSTIHTTVIVNVLEHLVSFL